MHMKNIPIILRTKKKNDRNDQFSTTNKAHTVFAFNVENINFSSGLDTTSNVDFEKETNKILHRQRKQLHNPLDKQCTYDLNNNRNKKARVDQTNDSANCEKNAPSKRKSNKSKKHSPTKKPKRAVTCKTSDRKTASWKTSNSETVMNISPNVVANNFFNTDVSVQSSHESNTSNCENDISETGTTFDNSTSFCYNNETNDLQKKCYDVSSNSVTSEQSMEPDAMTRMFEKDFINFGLIESIDNNNGMNILFDPELLHPCTYANCTSCNEDNNFFNDSLSTINDMELDYFTSCICSDFIMNDYDHILGETWLQESVEKNLCCGNIEEMNIVRENDSDSLANTVENNANVLVVEQKDVDVFNKEEPLSQDKTLSHSTVLADTSISNDTYQPQKDKKGKGEKPRNYHKKDLCFIQCTDCRKLFNGKNQFRKHFTRCTFLNEERSFGCNICQKRYKHKSSLAQHLKIVHNISYNRNEKCYVCTKCSKSYVRFRAFQRHGFLHEDM